MPTIDKNKEIWDGAYEWSRRGDEWSSAWGGPEMQWHGSILPRIHRFLPTGSILEIACGFGRWTHFLKDACENLSVVDLSGECIEACQSRFRNQTNINYFLNDGKSLDMISDGSIDFVFSFDSLVHADEGVLNAYIAQLPRILKPNGAAFLHHSNFGEYSHSKSWLRRYRSVEMFLEKMRVLEPTHMRDPGVTAETIRTAAHQNGLRCVTQEIIPWGTKRLHIDCLTTLVGPGSSVSIEDKVFRNPRFMQEAANLKQLSSLYG